MLLLRPLRAVVVGEFSAKKARAKPWYHARMYCVKIAKFLFGSNIDKTAADHASDYTTLLERLVDSLYDKNMLTDKQAFECRSLPTVAQGFERLFDVLETRPDSEYPRLIETLEAIGRQNWAETLAEHVALQSQQLHGKGLAIVALLHPLNDKTVMTVSFNISTA